MSRTSSATRTRPATIRVHGTELSTDREMFGPYAETMAMLLALVSLLAAAWVVAAPGETADLPAPDRTTAVQAAPEVYAVNRTAGADADVLWADPFDAPRATAVTVVPAQPQPAAPTAVG